MQLRNFFSKKNPKVILAQEILHPKPTVYICVELKNREFDSQILLAAEAVVQGYRCYVGTHAAIYALLRSKKEFAGILLDKSTQPYELMKWERTKCQYLFVMDAELSPIMRKKELAEEFPGRIYPGTDDLVDRFLCVGPAVHSIALAHYKQDTEKVVESGWPRIDIWKQYGEQIYVKEVSELKNKFGNFLLFVSSFGVIKDPNFDQHLKSAGIIVRTPNDLIETKRDIYLNFQTAVKILLEWDSNLDVPKIIVRPHTSEDNRIWRKALKGAKKTFVVAEGEITPWVLASDGVIHQGSSTALQAKFADKAVYFMPAAALLSNEGIAYFVSDYLVNGQNPPTTNPSESAPIQNVDYRQSLLEEVAYLHPEGASTVVITEFDGVEVTKEPPIKRLHVWLSQASLRSCRRALGLLRDEIQWIRKRTNIYPQSHAVPMGLRRSEVSRVLRSRSEFSDLKARRITLNLWEIS